MKQTKAALTPLDGAGNMADPNVQSTEASEHALSSHQEESIERFEQERLRYKVLAEVFRLVLEQARQQESPLAVVQCRAKEVSSFAGKVVRRRQSVARPLDEFTDLAGGRLIAPTKLEVAALCRLIEKRFTVDRKNSQDVGERLKVREFDYQSIHYIVSVSQSTIDALRIPQDQSRLQKVVDDCQAEAAFEKLFDDAKSDDLLDRVRAITDGLRGEIQIRTVLQHAWADVSHDRVYKAKIEVPAIWQRRVARMAAMLEVVDEQFDSMVHELDVYLTNYDVYLEQSRLESELKTTELVFAHETDDRGKLQAALKLAKLARAAGRWDILIDNVQPLIGRYGADETRELSAELGHALCRRHHMWTQHGPDDNRLGKAALESVTAAPPDESPQNIAKDEVRARALVWLAQAHEADGDSSQMHRDDIVALYQKAHHCHPENPYHLAAYVEHRLQRDGDFDFVEPLRAQFVSAIEACRQHSSVRVEIPESHFAVARFQLLLRQYRPCLSSYARAVSMCENARRIEEEYKSVHAIWQNVKKEPSLLWVQRLLLLAAVAKYRATAPQLAQRAEQSEHDAKGMEKASSKQGAQMDKRSQTIHARHKADAERYRAESWHCQQRAGELVAMFVDELRPNLLPTTDWPITIVAGGADVLDQEEHAKEKDHFASVLDTAFESYRGYILSGGTKSGVPGMIGKVTQDRNASDATDSTPTKPTDTHPVISIGYLPQTMPEAQDGRPPAKPDERYTLLLRTAGATNFTPLEPLQNWIDLLASGINPADVRVLGINGGEIATFEYELALALGATVGLVATSGRAVLELLADSDFNWAGSLLALPDDEMTVRCFVMRPGDALLTGESLDEAAQAAHENYLAERGGKRYADLNDAPWDELRDDLKDSNRQQISFSSEILKAAGYRVVQSDDAPVEQRVTDFETTPEDRERLALMAEMEHGRWNVERLRAGWRYAEQKDVENKLNPCIVPFKDLPNHIAKYDFDAVKKWPEHFEKANLAIIRDFEIEN